MLDFNDGNPASGRLYEYEVDKRNSPEDAVDLFDINEDGSLFLNDDGQLTMRSRTGTCCQ